MKTIIIDYKLIRKLSTYYIPIVYTVFGLYHLVYGSSLELSTLSFEGAFLLILGVMGASKWREDIVRTPPQIFRAVATGWMLFWAFAFVVSTIIYYMRGISTSLPFDVLVYILFVGSAYLFSFAQAMETIGRTSLIYGLSTALFGLSLMFGFGDAVTRIAYYFISGLILYKK